ncbi:hypothetical protein [Calditerrivibrio nitroreducens]|uniref:DUF4845 domain-containing protein n=1 Tax=Calditerrivibrio nitroreducens (strain DSM 19672 / NBRC 101217 / Yu37-1) TaxID=768670 RepID=E4THG3_CALNY|nr:hypothetical protein [Calditerrivibrio nitroreducens]ADR19898.1 hypothetical protein Calni_2004 [Calditerrivibrio nitroreducens DSM 19672]
MDTIKFLVKLFIAGYLIYTAIVFALPFAKFKIYEAAARNIIKSEKGFTPEKIKDLLIKEANEAMIELTSDNITMKDYENYITITIVYTSDVKLPLTKKVFTFEHKIEENRKKEAIQ